MTINEQAVDAAVLEVLDNMPGCANCLRGERRFCRYCTDYAEVYSRIAIAAYLRHVQSANEVEQQ